MLRITFVQPQPFYRDVGVYFNNRYEKAWLQDKTAKQIIADIDNAIVLSNGAIDSARLGVISPWWLSTNAKALILMLKTDKVIWGTACGDNCAKWIDKISRLKDITLYFEHPMNFDCELDAVCIDNNRKIRNNDDFMDCYLESKGLT